MKKIGFIFLCIILIVGCGTDQQVSKGKKEPAGVYYEKIDKKEVGKKYDPMASYSYSLLSYKNSVYTSSVGWTWEGESKEVEEYANRYLGDKIGEVYSNRELYWSVDKTDLYESTGVGTLYRVKGYQEKYRVCIFYKTEGEGDSPVVYGMEMFDCLNDIYLEYGKELFQERLCLDNFNVASGEEEGRKWTKQEIQAFRESLYQGRFTEEGNVDIAGMQEDGKTILFFDGLGQNMEFLVCEDGGVLFERGGGNWFVLQME